MADWINKFVDAGSQATNKTLDFFFGGARDWANEPAVEAAEADRAWQEQHTAKQNAFSAEQAELAWERNQQSAREAMAFEANQARINREWQQEMSNTAYQRQIADLKKAGINPIFALNGGGASTPSGATASGSAGYASPAQGTSARGAQANVSTTFLRDMVLSAVSVASAVGSAVSMFKKVPVTAKTVLDGNAKLPKMYSKDYFRMVDSATESQRKRLLRMYK